MSSMCIDDRIKSLNGSLKQTLRMHLWLLYMQHFTAFILLFINIILTRIYMHQVVVSHVYVKIICNALMITLVLAYEITNIREHLFHHRLKKELEAENNPIVIFSIFANGFNVMKRLRRFTFGFLISHFIVNMVHLIYIYII